MRINCRFLILNIVKHNNDKTSNEVNNEKCGGRRVNIKIIVLANKNAANRLEFFVQMIVFRKK